MKYFLTGLKKPLADLGRLILILGIAALILLYFLGYYDFSFIDRAIENYTDKYSLLYEGEDTESRSSAMADAFSAIVDMNSESENGDDTAKADAVTDNFSSDVTGGENDTSDDTGITSSQFTNVKTVYRASDLPSDYVKLCTEDEAKADGYDEFSQTADYESGSTILARMTFRFKLPEEYSVRKRIVTKTNVVTPDDDTEKYTETVKVKEDRPCVEMYMGYILIDKGKNIYIVSSDGVALCQYSPDKYTPAYERDTEGHPLFLRLEYGKTVGYVYLSDDGMSFIESDFDPDTDSRGLSFDYPADYGVSDSTSVSVDYSEAYKKYAYIVTTTEEVEVVEDDKDEDGDTDDSGDSADAADDEADEDAETSEKKTETVTKTAKLTDYSFTFALPFSNNMAAVATSKNRGAMYFINQDGKEAFKTVKYYYNEYDRYVGEFLMLPLTTGIENIGSFSYDDNGLVMVRRQIIDYWNWYMRGRIRVVEDKNVLLRKDGSVYELPTGYELVSYSEGMIMVTKNDRVGFIDYTGEWIAQPIYTEATPFIQGLAALTDENGKTGMIDVSGNIVLPFAYESVSQVSSGIIAAYSEDTGWNIYKILGKN